MAKKSNCFFSPRTFATWLGLIVFAQILAGAYTKSVLTTIERRYQFSSTVTAIIASGSQIGNLTVMIFVSYFGQRFHRPRLIAFGCLIMIVGYLVTALPQFIGGRYEYDDISVNTSTKSDGEQQHITCQERIDDNSTTELSCGEKSDADSSFNLYIAVIIIGIMLLGIGSSPCTPLGLSYVDDHANEHNAAVYIGIINSIALVGPVAGFLLGSFVLKMWVDSGWVDTSTINVTPKDPAWVGAWWIGFIVAATVLLFASIPVWFYPREMEKEKERENKKKSSTKSKKKIAQLNARTSSKQNAVTKELSGMLAALKKLAGNRRYTFVIAAWIFEWFKISSVSSFTIKYLEVGFGKSAAVGSFLIGTVNLPFLVLGTILGSLAIKRFKMNQSAMVKLILSTYVVSLIVYIAFMVVGCDTIDVAGITVPYPDSDPSDMDGHASEACNDKCNCDENMYTPVCGADGISYVSPCYAGCTGFEQDENGIIRNYTSCSCTGVSSVVSVGRCMASKCEPTAWVVIILKTITNFVSGVAATPTFVLLIRSLKPEEKSFGIGIAFFICRLLGWIPAPIIVGFGIDQACLFWTRSECSDRAYCRLYNTKQYRLIFAGILTVVKVGSTTVMCFMLRHVKMLEKMDSEEEDDIVTKEPEHQRLTTEDKDKSLDVDKETVI